MSITDLFAHDVTLLIRDDSATDDFGNTRPGYTDGVTVKGRLRRLSAQEVAQAGETSVGDWVLYLSPDVDLEAHDRVKVLGDVYELDADPYIVYDVDAPHHQEVRVRSYG